MQTGEDPKEFPVVRAFVLGTMLPALFLLLGLRITVILARYSPVGPVQLLDVLRSDILWLGAVALMGATLIGLARQRSRTLAMITVVILQLMALAWMGLESVAHIFFRTTGAVLDYDLFRHALGSFSDLSGIFHSVTPEAMILVLASFSLFWLALPWYVYFRISTGSLGWPKPLEKTSRRLALALLCFAISSLPPAFEAERAFGRAMVWNMAFSYADALTREPHDPALAAQPTLDIKLVRKDDQRPKNVVFIVLESIRTSATSYHDSTFDLTPTLEALSAHSLVAMQAYTTVPHTSKALVSILCGIDPYLRMPIREAGERGLPTRCLPELLAEHGYRTAFLQSATGRFESRGSLVDNMGFETFLPIEAMDPKDFAVVNYFGYEEDIMLEPARLWHEADLDTPFFATYLTLTAHHDYRPPARPDGYERHVDDEEFNRYLNAVQYVDGFLGRLLDQYRALGIYENTLFVIVSDHGEAFGEHLRYQHDNVIYQEGIHVPLLVHRPWEPTATRLETPVTTLDLLPTTAELLGFEVEFESGAASLPGFALGQAPPNRPIFAHCYYARRCAARIIGDEKFIHHFDRQPDELFDLRADPLERHNILADREAGDIETARRAVKEWRSKVIGMYEGFEGR
ncbi:MAG: sulfatase-like hydrolase/transferase [Bradymonadaceae bacterium]